MTPICVAMVNFPLEIEERHCKYKDTEREERKRRKEADKAWTEFINQVKKQTKKTGFYISDKDKRSLKTPM